MSYKFSHTGKDFAKKYDANIASNFESRIYEIEKIVLFDILKRYFPNVDFKVMDFASGTGRMTSLLSEIFHDVVGFDISEDMIEVAREKFPKISFFQRDISSDEIDERFDLITAFRFFLNAEAPLKQGVLEKLSPLLKQDGQLLFNIHMNSYSFLFLASRLKYLLGLTNIKQNGMSYFDVKNLAESTGYKIVYVRGYSFFSGNPLFNFLPLEWVKILDVFLSKIPFLGYFAKDMLYILKKKND